MYLIKNIYNNIKLYPSLYLLTFDTVWTKVSLLGKRL